MLSLNLPTITGLVNNAALLLALGVLYDLSVARPRGAKLTWQQVLSGVILGSIGIAVMLTRWEFGPGVVFDTRSVLLGISGLFFGTVPTALAVLMTGTYRIITGGSGMEMGVAVIVASGAIGIAWRNLRQRALPNISIVELYGFGLVIHVVMLSCTLLLPLSVRREVFTTIAVPVMVIYPVATALLGQLLVNHETRRLNAEQLRVSEARYRGLNEHLEELVRQRTAELGERVTEVEALNDRLAGLLLDVRETNGRLEVAQAELRSANDELESFAYSVSHDLRAPLRAMDGFSRILLAEYAEDLPDEAGRYLRLVRENAEQMGQLIDDLLEFSRLGRHQIDLHEVAPEDIVRRVLEDLRPDQEGRNVEVSIGSLPPCKADPRLLKQVWLNLLSNALKYTRRREVARIRVGSMEKDGECVYFVKDNGVGFDMQYVDKLFGVFQRLHRAEDYEGTGVGLAIVQRIVRRHGGRVWAEAVEVPRRADSLSPEWATGSETAEVGATFYFTIQSGTEGG